MAASNYAAFKTASLAKEKGYEPIINSDDVYWDMLGRYIRPHSWYSVLGLPHLLHAPTQAELQKWIRVEKKIHVEIYCNASGWGWILTKLNGTGLKDIEDCIFFDSYEIALEAGLVLALNHKKVS